MLNDTILSGLVNLFALLGAKSGVGAENGRKLLEDYLRHHFGLRDGSTYISLYDDLRMLYDSGAGVDMDRMLGNISTNLRGRVEPEELSLLLLRLMEFCRTGSGNGELDEVSFRDMATQLGVEDELCSDFLDYVRGTENGRVRNQVFEGYDGVVRTLWIQSFGILVFSYFGKDTVLFDDMPLTPGVFRIWNRSGVFKNRKGAPLYYSSVRSIYTGSSVKDIVFCGKDVNFRFPGSDNGIHNLSFSIRSGELVAIMGGSGTGKTTLLSLLNGTLKPQEGSLTINGTDISDPSVKGLVGFVPQDDLLIEELTVYQNLYYTALLCFKGLSEEEIDRKVMDVLKDLCLDHARDLVVGSPLNKTISGGQRKRLNIALELIREPVVLFLDEPTSGLSSADTENVMGLLKDQTALGRLVVVNIHQPSSDVYKLFDRLWLLDKGGYPVFDGNPIDAITCFKTAANHADADTSTCPVCGNVNPEIVLNIIEEKSLDSNGRTRDERKTTPQQWHEAYLATRNSVEVPEKTPIPESDQRKPGAFGQFRIFLERNVKAKITNLQYIVITLLEAPLLALVCSALTHFSAAGGYTLMENKHLVSYFFMAIIVATFLGMSGSAEEIIRDRTLLKREKYLNLSYHAYIWSKIAYCAAVSLVQTALFVIVGNLVMGIHGLFFMWWFILFVTSLLSNLVGLLLSQCLNSIVAIYITIPILLIPQILLCGLVVPFSDLGRERVPDNVPLIGDVIPSRWAFEAAAVGSFMYNDYEKPYFEYDRARYEALFYRESFIYELESQLETMEAERYSGKEVNPVHAEVIRNGLPKLAAVSGVEYTGDFGYESLNSYFKEAAKALSSISNRNTLEKDRLISAEVAEKGSELLVKRKRNNYNLQLENVLTGAASESPLRVVRGHIVPRTGAVFLTPESRCGRAPFYSSVKRLGNLNIPTLWFNMSIMFFFSILLIFALLLNIPDKNIKQNNLRTK